MREQFEAWALSKDLSVDRDGGDPERYYWDETWIAWAAWQAACAAEREDATRKLLAEVKRLEGMEDRLGANYYHAHAQALYNWVRKEYADIMRPPSAGEE